MEANSAAAPSEKTVPKKSRPHKPTVLALHDARRICRQVEIGGAGFHAGDEPVRPERDHFNIGRLRQRGEDHVAAASECARIFCPGRARVEMMTGRLSP